VVQFRPSRSTKPLEDGYHTLSKKKAKKTAAATSQKDKLSKQKKIASSEVETCQKVSESVVKQATTASF
jgi:hypothetical protein